jgi:6-pyruvoyltetrahydropterin/6-carboxytetrahydropterin synthase
MKIALTKTFQIEAAHHLPLLPKTHKCSRMHGHSFQIEIRVEGECDPQWGWLMDYSDIKAAFQPIYDLIDHNCLNEIQGLENPTSEILAKWVWERLKPRLPMLSTVSVAETCTSRAEYRGE